MQTSSRPLARHHHPHRPQGRYGRDRRRRAGLDRPDHRQGQRQEGAPSRQGRRDRRTFRAFALTMVWPIVTLREFAADHDAAAFADGKDGGAVPEIWSLRLHGNRRCRGCRPPDANCWKAVGGKRRIRAAPTCSTERCCRVAAVEFAAGLQSVPRPTAADRLRRIRRPGLPCPST